MSYAIETRSPLLSLWSLPQPVFVFGCTILTASAFTTRWTDPGSLVSFFVLAPIPFLLVLERFMPRRRDWLLNWRDLGEDTFWVLATYFIWVPIYDQRYDTPISNVFTSLREVSGFPYRLEADTITGLLVASIVGIFAIEFIGYWAHRVQHRFMFLWRIHATHYHISKMSAARADRTHPLEFLGLNLGSAVALAFLGASAEVVGVVLVFRLTTAHVCHCNLPLVSGVFGWFFNTAEWHQLHHSCDYAESNTNYGCTVIFWDRVFGTFSGKSSIERVGNGTGRRLSLLTQLTIPFRSNDVLRNL
jgi:sterol desaturase/sphingolipid hydroxylase (fatty acid hydroxylase superfamily)